MKKILLAILFIPTLAGAAQQEITVVPDDPVIPSIGSLKDAVNLRLANIDENFDEIYPALTAGPVYVNTTAPADTKVVWIDTDQDNAIKVRIGEVWTVVGTAGEGSYALPTAAADTLGGVKVGDRLSITDGVLSADVQTTDISGKEDSLGNPSTNGYVLASTTAGVRSWIEMTGGGTGIAHATADGKWYGSKDGAWVDLAPTFSSALPKWIDMSVGYAFTAGDLTWYNGQVWKASGTHPKVLGEYPDAESTDWEDYVSAPVVVDYPTVVGVPSWTAEGWAETSYTVGTAANNLVQLNVSAQLPAVSGALLTNIPLPTWMPSAAPPADNMIIQATGGCSNITYTDQATCEDNSGTWTPPVGAWTSIIDGLINDAGTGTDDLLSASQIDSRISSAVALYQVADADLVTAAGADTAGNSKMFGTNSSGVVGWYDIPTGTGTDEAEQKIPSTLAVTTDATVTAQQIADNKYLSNYGASGEVDIILPAVSYNQTRTILIEAGQVLEISPPSGEVLELSGTDLTADYCVNSGSVVGNKATVTRLRTGESTWKWSIDVVRGTWESCGGTSD